MVTHRHMKNEELTKSTTFEEIRNLLEHIKDSLENELQFLIVDDSCRVRSLYQSLLPSVKVKLDFFHVMTVEKQTTCQHLSPISSKTI